MKTKWKSTLLFTLFCTACGVQTGNIGADDEGANMFIQIVTDDDLGSIESQADSDAQLQLFDTDNYLFSASLTSEKRFQLGVASITLYGTNSSSGKAIAHSVESPEEFLTVNSANSEYVPQISAESIPKGLYTEVVIKLRPTQALRVKRNDKEFDDIEIDSDFAEGIRLPISIDLESVTTDDLILSLDFDRSLVKGTDGRTRFKPRGGVHSIDRFVSLELQTTVESANYACAYGFEIEVDPRFKQGNSGQARDPRAGDLNRVPRFDSKEEIEFDETSDCLNAYSRASVEAGSYIMHLKPGLFFIRVFKESGEFEDLEAPIKVKPKKRRRPQQKP